MAWWNRKQTPLPPVDVDADRDLGFISHMFIEHCDLGVGAD